MDVVAPSNETNIGTTVVITNKTPGPTGVERMVDGATDRMEDTLTAVDRMVVDTPTVTATTITTTGVAERSRTAGGRTLAPSGFRSNTSAKKSNPSPFSMAQESFDPEEPTGRVRVFSRRIHPSMAFLVPSYSVRSL